MSDAKRSLTSDLKERGLIQAPPIIFERLCYETQIGSYAYGVSQDASDMDVYGFCVPPKHVVFPHLNGEIMGFGRQIQRFDNYQQHHIDDVHYNKKYDLSIYNIIKYVQLCMENNPNMLETLFTSDECVIYADEIALRLREQRRLFLHKGSWHKFKGFAHSQLNKMINKKPEGKRLETVERFGFDVKFAYHAIRLLLEAEQILVEGDLDLRRHAATLLEIRRGEWTIEQVNAHYRELEARIEPLYDTSSSIPHSPPEDAIKLLLLECLEIAWGDLEGCLHWPPHRSLLVGAPA
jgi:predicted nucleotidyltransferase